MNDTKERPRLFQTKLNALERRGGSIVDERDDGVVLVFPDGSGCTLSDHGRVDWFKAV